ncbi:unnamed protein product [Microthlaspi erraticum]|uniref:Retrotransposon gag domain-containing protein n=1 Tax=Microthlaspi erraticum TaxID=1685480 RepID=A0A6D2KFF7_9BRAS|nr:unnamed protein product [Microthlaspi erraticum]
MASSSPSPSELENVVPDTPEQAVTMNQPLSQMEKDMCWLKIHFENLLRPQGQASSSETPAPGPATPISGAQQSVPSTPAPQTDKAGGEGLLPTPKVTPFPQPTFFPPKDTKQGQRSELYGNQSEIPSKKVDLPLYEGNNPEDWLFRLEKCFEMNHVSEWDKLDQALTCLTGSAITWWRFSQEREQINTWKDFKDNVKVRFKPSRGSASVDHLLNIVQKGTVNEYRDRFEELSVELPHVPDDVLEAAFLKGLKKSLRDQVVRCRPGNMTDIVEVARLIESQEGENQSFYGRSFRKPVAASGSSFSNRNQSSNNWRSGDNQTAKRNPEATKDNRKPFVKSNLCNYNCGEKWFPGHRCRQRLKCMEVEEDENQPKNEAIEQEEGENLVEDGEEQQELVTLSLHSMAGLTTETSMKMWGSIGDRKVVVLIDSGATSNFITEKVAKEMKLPLAHNRGFGVLVGGGKVMRGKGRCLVRFEALV